MLLEERASIAICDPRALDNARIDLRDVPGEIEYCRDPLEAAKGAHAVALLTEWPEFSALDYRKIFEVMEKPAFVFDGRNLLDHRALFEIGFNVFPLGKTPLTHF